MKQVPTVIELTAMGLAHPASFTSKGAPSTYSISPEGHALLGAIMRENALEFRALGSADWTQPPSSRGLPPLTELTGAE